MSVNEIQVGGTHYKSAQGEQHWDRVYRLNMNWYAANVTKYVERYPFKNGLEDLKKAQHYLTKLIEVEEAKMSKLDLPKIDDGSDPVARGYADQDSQWGARVSVAKDVDGPRWATPQGNR